MKYLDPRILAHHKKASKWYAFSMRARECSRAFDPTVSDGAADAALLLRQTADFLMRNIVYVSADPTTGRVCFTNAAGDTRPATWMESLAFRFAGAVPLVFTKD